MRSETIAVVAVAAVALLVFGFLGVMWLLVSLPGTGSGSSTELQCETTPKPICFRLVDHISDSYKGPNPDLPFDIVTVTPTACDGHDEDPAMARCWNVNGRTAAGVNAGAFYYQREDGTLVGPEGPLADDAPS